MLVDSELILCIPKQTGMHRNKLSIVTTRENAELFELAAKRPYRISGKY